MPCTSRRKRTNKTKRRNQKCYSRKEKTNLQMKENGLAGCEDFDNFLASRLFDGWSVETGSVQKTREEKTDSDGFSADQFFVVLDKPYEYYERDNLNEIVSHHSCRVYSKLRHECEQLSNEQDNFTFLKHSSGIKFIQTYESEYPTVKLCVSIQQNFSIHIQVHGRHIPTNHEIWTALGQQCYDVQCMAKILNEVSKYNVCPGNRDKDLQSLIPLGAYLDVAGSKKYQGYKEPNYDGSTIRSTSCFFLVSQSGKRCRHCVIYRKTLMKTKARRQSRENVSTPDKDWTKCKTANDRLTESQLVHKVKQMRTKTKSLEAENAKLSRKIKGLIRREGVTLNEVESLDLKTVVEGSTKEVEKCYPDENSYQRLFWDQQLKRSRLGDKRSMRWHPMLIKWCIFLKSKSSSTYDALRNSGFIKLPSARILFDYTSVVQKGTGFRPDVVDVLIEETMKFEGHQRIVGLLQDEVRIKSDLVYDKHSGELIGFLDLGNVSNDMDQLLKTKADKKKPLAKYVLVLMVRGVSSNLKFPLAHFATSGVTSDQLFCILWQGVEILEVDAGLEVLFITSDGASPNRRFIRLHGRNGHDSVVFKAKNLFSHDDRLIYFISDAPHLIKTTGNCFGNSFSHKKPRRLWKDGRDISWMHIVNLYQDHCSGVYRLCPKLSKSHINISAFSAMKVRLATQVLAETVGNALEEKYGDQVLETVKFIRHIDKFFDCLNVKHLTESKMKRKPALEAYTSVNDERSDYLVNDFLKYFKDWDASIENRIGDFTKSQKNGMRLSYQTLQVLTITVQSIVCCIKYCLQKGMPYVLTERFNQDPIEQHFGVHRSSLGCNTNPNLKDFNHAMVNIRTVGGQAIAPFRGNTKREIVNPEVDNTPMRKRSAIR